MPKVCIIIVNFNGKQFIKDCLENIKRNTKYKDYKVVFVDNNSLDGSEKFVSEKYPWVDLIANKTNRGFSGGNNDGILYAAKKYNPDYFFILGNDTKVQKNWLQECIKLAESKTQIGIVGSKQMTFEGKESIFAAWFHPFGVKYYFGNLPKKVNWVSGACFLIKKEVIKKIGMLDEIYNPCYYEETDLEKRAEKAGFEVWVCPKSIVYHKVGGTNSKLKTDFIYSLMYRNRIIYFLKHYGILYFLPRFFYDCFKALKVKRLKLLFSSYNSGLKKLKDSKKR